MASLLKFICKNLFSHEEAAVPLQIQKNIFLPPALKVDKSKVLYW